MLVNRRFDALVVVLVVGIVGYTALQPTYRLRESAPSEFMHEARCLPAQKRAAEEKIAKAYWKRAVTDVQWHHGYGHRLPATPPDAFRLSAQDYGPKAADVASQACYWAKLQELWFVKESWRAEYDLNFQSCRRWLQVAGNWIEVQARHLLG